MAIKCISKASLNKLSTENLLTEIELLKTLKHENIVELKDFEVRIFCLASFKFSYLVAWSWEIYTTESEIFPKDVSVYDEYVGDVSTCHIVCCMFQGWGTHVTIGTSYAK